MFAAFLMDVLDLPNSIEIALTIEPADPASNEEGVKVAPSKRLKAFQTVNGYMIPVGTCHVPTDFVD